MRVSSDTFCQDLSTPHRLVFCTLRLRAQRVAHVGHLSTATWAQR